MNKSWILPLLLISLTAPAQREKIWGDPHIVEKFTAEAKLNPAYVRLINQLNSLSKSANRINTNAAAVKSLLARNNALLNSLYVKAGLETPMPVHAAKQPATISYTARATTFQLAKLFKHLGLGLVKYETAPYEKSWTRMGGHSNDGGYPDSASSQYAAGKIALVSNSIPYCAQNPEWSGCKLGFYQQGYLQKFTVPSNPAIIAAEIKFEYSYFYTGWDTYGATAALDLVLRADDKINSESYNSLPDGPSGSYPNPPTDRWKKIATLLSMDTVVAEFDEFHASGESSFSIEGYVTPGTEFEVRVGFGYPTGTKRGINGSYHYAEFILKKITVNYYKTAN